MKPSEILTAARDLIDNKGWCRFNYAQDANGYAVQPDNPYAAHFCAIGAIMAVAPGSGYAMQTKLIRLLEKVSSDRFGMGVICVNDTLGIKATLKLYDDAIEQAKATE